MIKVIWEDRTDKAAIIDRCKVNKQRVISTCIFYKRLEYFYDNGNAVH